MTKFEAANLLEEIVKELDESSSLGEEIDWALNNIEHNRDDLYEAFNTLNNKNYDNWRF